MSRAAICIALLGLLPTTASAIIIRHDRDDSAYRELAHGFDFVCVVGGAMGTLVDPEWVLTAAHVAEPLGQGDVIRFGPREIPIAEVIPHPDFGFAETHRDLALIRLAEPVTDLRPALLHHQDDEVGQRVTLVGEGQTGTGETGPTDEPEVLRAAHNVVDSATPGWISFDFDAPPAGEDLEGISGPGDSGGPALIRRDAGWAIVGVSAYNDGEPVCTYGTREFYCRVSDNLPWIRGVMSGEIGRSTEPSILVHGTDEQGRATVSREAVVSVQLSGDEARTLDLVVRLSTALNDGDLDGYREMFSARCIDQQRKAGDPVEGMFEFFQGAREARGKIVGIHELPPEGVQIPESGYPMQPVIFHLADGTPGYFGIATDDVGQIDHLSLFVQRSICDGGRSCDSVALDIE